MIPNIIDTISIIILENPSTRLIKFFANKIQSQVVHQFIPINIQNTIETTNRINQIIIGDINIQNRFFFHMILHKAYTFRTGIIDSRHFLHAFLNIIHIQTIENNQISQQIISCVVVIQPIDQTP